MDPLADIPKIKKDTTQPPTKPVSYRVLAPTFVNGQIVLPYKLDGRPNYIDAEAGLDSPHLVPGSPDNSVAPNPPLPQSAGIDPQLATATARVAELEAALADKDKQIAAAQIAGEGAIARVAELEAQIAAAAKPQAVGNGGKAQK